MGIDTVAGQVGSLVMAAISAYGTAALSKAEDVAATGTVRMGQRLLAKLLGRAQSSAAIKGAVTDLAGELGDPDFQAALRAQIKKAMREDTELMDELSGLLAEAGGSVVASERSIAVGHDSHGINSTGDAAVNIQQT
jgi:hypothetical protein